MVNNSVVVLLSWQVRGNEVVCHCLISSVFAILLITPGDGLRFPTTLFVLDDETMKGGVPELGHLRELHLKTSRGGNTTIW